MSGATQNNLNKENIKILIAFGTRPEAIKMCPLVRELRSRGVGVKVCVTGQHKEILYSAMKAFGVSADYDFGIMSEGQTLFDLTERILAKMKSLLAVYTPDVILVHGDTTTAFAVALAGFYSKIPVAHVEAGLRSYDLSSPYPEELNRRAITLMSRAHFAPTNDAACNLLSEGVPSSQVFVTGNTVVDALGYTLRKGFKSKLLKEMAGKRIIFLTAHRRESHGKTLENMLLAVRRISESFEDVGVIYPVHPNPNVKNTAEKILGGRERIILCPPLDVVECHNVMAKSYMLLTDSGGIQEEAAALRRPALVMRNVTERPEGIKAGISALAGTDGEQIFVTVKRLLEDKKLYEKMRRADNPYGSGNACGKIADILLNSNFGNK